MTRVKIETATTTTVREPTWRQGETIATTSTTTSTTTTITQLPSQPSFSPPVHGNADNDGHTQVIVGGKGFAFYAKKGTRFRVMDMYGQQVVDMCAWPIPTTSNDTIISTAGTSTNSGSDDQTAVLNQLQKVKPKLKQLPKEHLSMAVSRYRLGGNPPILGECLYTNAFKPLLRLREDTCGMHDMGFMCCSPEMYKLSGIEGSNSCAENIRDAINTFLDTSPSTDQTTEPYIDEADTAARCSEGKTSVKGRTTKIMESHLEVPDPFNTFQNTPKQSLKPRTASRAGDFVDWEVLQDALIALSACPYTVFGFNGGKATNVAVSWNLGIQEPWFD